MYKKIINKYICKKNLKVLSALLITSLFAVTPIYTFASETIVEKNGVTTKLEIEPITSDTGHLLVSLREIGNIMDCDIAWDAEISEAKLTKDTFEITVKSNEKFAMVNGKISTMDTPSIINDGRLMVPIRFIAEAFSQDVSWVESERKVVLADKLQTLELDEVTPPPMRDKIERGDEELSIIMNYTDYIEDKKNWLSFDEATQIAYSENTTIDKLEYSLETMDLQRSELVFQLYETTMASSVIKSIKSIDLSVLDIEEQKETLAILTEQSVMSAANSLITQKLDQISLLKSIENEERNLVNQTLLYELGEVSSVSYEESKLNLEQSKNSYKLLLLSEESDKQSVNKLLGRTVTSDINIEYRSVFFQPIDDDIENHIKVDYSNDPNYHSLEREIILAQFDYDNISSATQREILIIETALEDAKDALLDYEKDYENTVRSYYNSLQSLKNQQSNNYIDLDRAWEDYKNLYINYEAGNVTEYQLMVMEYSILSKEISIIRNYLQQSSTSFMLEYPYLAL